MKAGCEFLGNAKSTVENFINKVHRITEYQLCMSYELFPVAMLEKAELMFCHKRMRDFVCT